MKNNQGFTLIEMLIVIAIIAILSGIVLVGVSGFQASARDSRRISDIRNAQNLLELYYTQQGVYPEVAGWDDLNDAIASSTDALPQPPAAGDLDYYYESTDGLEYVAGAELERPNNAARENAVTIDSVDGNDCSETVYCVTSL
ncbi:MAG: prepilin-type N-terminal cleavage/methylation domain-containing protein [Candidatus Colwellbacteria bacterium]|nr:prepilin-type N-terminal cleavage/methylation domain-containing protein [Candidatus Colwellbacteria bacterium]